MITRTETAFDIVQGRPFEQSSPPLPGRKASPTDWSYLHALMTGGMASIVFPQGLGVRIRISNA